ncbi:MAG TPA: hypothetical protein VID04_11085 [Methylomirabilota bacterium]|jgi:hypothetical protein
MAIPRSPRIYSVTASMTAAELLDNWALSGEDLAPDTRRLFESELKRRGIGVSAEDRALWRARRRREVLTTHEGQVARCRWCGRLAGRAYVIAFDLLLARPLGSLTLYHCEAHEPALVSALVRAARALSNLLFGVRSWWIRAGHAPARLLR